MPLSQEQIAAVRAAAAEAGVDPAELVAAAEEIESEEQGESAKSTAGLPKSDKVYQYHLPFIKVVELRQSLGLTERIPDDELTCLEYQMKHGGQVATVSAPQE